MWRFQFAHISPFHRVTRTCVRIFNRPSIVSNSVPTPFQLYHNSRVVFYLNYDSHKPGTPTDRCRFSRPFLLPSCFLSQILVCRDHEAGASDHRDLIQSSAKQQLPSKRRFLIIPSASGELKLKARGTWQHRGIIEDRSRRELPLR